MLSSFRQCREGAERRQFDLALVLLGRAADRDDRMLLPTSVTAGRAELDLVLRRLLGEGLIEEIAVENPEQAWRHGGRFGLRMTAAGLKAIGVPALASGPPRGFGLGWAGIAVIDIVRR